MADHSMPTTERLDQLMNIANPRRTEWRDDLKHGKGTSCWSGETYTGEWVEGCRHGHGVLSYGPDDVVRVSYEGKVGCG